MDLLQKIKKDLPNFPNEIITSWLLPFAKDIGWPPNEQNNWPAKLFYRSCSYWRELIWQKMKINFSEISLTPGYENMINTMLKHYIQGIDSHGNSPKRINDVLEHLKQHGKLPLPPILLCAPSVEKGYEIADGNHRITALRLYRKKSSPITEHDVWIGKLPTPEKEVQYIVAEDFFW